MICGMQELLWCARLCQSHIPCFFFVWLGPTEVQRHNLFDLPDNQWMRTAALIMTSNWFKPSHLHFTMLSLCFHPALEEILSQTIHAWYFFTYFLAFTIRINQV